MKKSFRIFTQKKLFSLSNMCNLKNKIVPYYLFFIVTLVLSNNILAIEVDSIPLKKHYKVGYRENYSPYEFMNGNFQADGYIPELLKEIAKSENITFEFVPIPYGNLFKVIDEGKVDIINFTQNTEREKLYSLSIPVCEITQAFFKLSKNSKKIDLQHLSGLSIGFIENDSLPSEIHKRTDFKRIVAISKVHGFSLLNKKEIDLLFTGEKNGIDILSEYGFTNIEIVTGAIYSRKNVFATLPQHAKLTQLLNQGILKLEKSGKIDALKQKWLADEIVSTSWVHQNQKTLMILLSAFIIFIILLLFWNFFLRKALNRKALNVLDSEEKYKYMFEHNPQIMMIYDIETLKFIDVNDYAVNKYGYSKEEFLSMTIKDIRPAEEIPEVLANVEIAKKGSELKGEWKHLMKNGEIIEVESMAYSLIYKGRKARHVLVNDITERKKAERALQESEEKYSILFKDSPDAYLILENGVFIDCNSATERMLGMTKDNIVGKNPDELSPEFQPDGTKSAESALNKISKTLQEGSHTFEWAHLRFDGTEILVEVTLASMMLGGKQTIFTTWRDISKRKAAEIMLNKERTLLRSLIDNIPETIFCKDLECRKTLSNKAEIKFLGGETEADILGKDDSYFLPKELADKYMADDRLIMQSGIPMLDIVEHIVDLNGNQNWLLTSKIPLRDENDQIIGLIGICRNITEQKRNEVILQNERLLLRTIIDSIPDAISLKDIKAKKILVNLADIKAVGLKEKDILGKDDLELYPKEIAEKFYTDDMYVIKTGQSIVNKEEYKVDEFGVMRCTLTTKIPIKDKDGNITGLIGIGRDITDRKIAEEALLESEKFLKSTQQIAKLGTLSLDLETGSWESSEVSDLILGIDQNFKRTFDNAVSIIHPDWKEELERHFFNEVIANKTKFDKKAKIIRKNDGQEAWIHGFGEVILNEEGVAVKIIGTIQDITTRKKLAEKLRKSEALYSSILNASPDLIVITNIMGCIEYISPGFVTPLGLNSKEVFVGHNILEFVYEEDQLKVQREIEKAFKGEHIDIQEYRLAISKDNYIYTEVNGDIILNDKGEPLNMIFVIRDISNRKLTEQALKQSQDNYRTMIDYSNDLIWTLDLVGNFTFFNEIAAKTTGLDTNAWLGKSFLPVIMEEDQEEIIAIFEKNINGEACTYELRFKKADGEILTILVNTSPIFSNGKVDGVVSFGRDITERKRMEEALNSSQEKLKYFASHLQNVREEERVMLAREIHDDLGQILIALKIDLGILKQKVLKGNQSNNDDLATKFEELVELVDNTIQTTRKIMTGLRPEVLELLGFIESAKLYTIDFEKRYKIDCRFNNKISELNINSQQSIALYRILQEALTNVARHSKATTVIVSLWLEDKKLNMTIADNGVGISDNQNVKQNSFGLIGMKERVFLLGGEINISSYQNKGTEVKVTMPYNQI